MQDDRERLRQEAREGVATLASALSEFGYAVGEVNGPAVHALPSLIDEAMRWERQAVERMRPGVRRIRRQSPTG